MRIRVAKRVFTRPLAKNYTAFHLERAVMLLRKRRKWWPPLMRGPDYFRPDGVRPRVRVTHG